VPNTFVTYPELAAYGIPYSRKHLIDLQKTGNFPKAVQLSARRIAWRIRDIEEWVSSRAGRCYHRRRQRTAALQAPAASQCQ
jgi:predicted DNA-binding transcriptional regulator AlpA